MHQYIEKTNFLETQLERENEKQLKKQQNSEQEQLYENKWVYYSFKEGFQFMKNRRDEVIARRSSVPIGTILGPPTDWKNTPIGTEESFIEKCKNDDFERGYAALVDSKDNHNSEIAQALQRMDRELPVLAYSYPMFVTEPLDFLKTYSVLSVGIIGSKKSLPVKTSKLQTSNNEDNARQWQHTIKTILGSSKVFIGKCKAELGNETRPYHRFWSNVAYQIIQTNLDHPYPDQLRLPPLNRPNGKPQLKMSTAIQYDWQRTQEMHDYVIDALRKGLWPLQL